MYRSVKILIITLILLAGCSKSPILNRENILPSFSNSKKEKVNFEQEIFNENKKKDLLSTIEKAEAIKNIENISKYNKEIGNANNIFQEGISTENEGKTLEEKKWKLNSQDNLKNSNISFYAIDLNTGKEIANYRGDKIVIPASVMKIITTATAFEVLGVDTKLETKVMYDGKIDKNGILNGDIYIVGGGDPTLGSDEFKENRDLFMTTWVDSIKKAGIKKINGEIIVIDDLFGYDGVPGSWMLEDLATSYGQAVYGISIYDNITNIFLSSDNKNIKILKVRPVINNLKFENYLKISPNGKNKIYVRGVPFENKRYLVGEMRKNQKKIVIKTDIPDPAMFLGELFKENLKKNNINVKGAVKTARKSSKRPKKPQVLIITQSKTIGEIIKVILTRSDNHYAEHLYKLMKLKNIDIKEYWSKKGIDTKALVMYDGSGLSRANNLSAKTLVEILVYMKENYPKYMELLPRAGYDGTVVDFLPKERFEGIGKIKSGSMSGIQAYAGYLEKGDKKIAVALIINQWNGSRIIVKREMERIVKELF